MLKVILLLNFCLVLQWVDASLFNRCTNPQAMSSFDPQKVDNLNKNNSSNSSNATIIRETLKFIKNINQLTQLNMTFTLNSNATGELTAEVPETSWFWRMLGWKSRTIKMKILNTDYANYEISYLCNEEPLVFSRDEIHIGVREANMNVSQSIMNATALKLGYSLKEMKKFTIVIQTSPSCNNVTFNSI